MKHLDLFSGYGGFTIACEKFGIETIGFSEIEKNAIQVLKNKYPNTKNYGDINEITNLPDFDLLTGGFPCQDLSVAGKQKGLAGERSGLFFQIIRIIKEKQPANFILENVKGLLSSQNGWDFARVQIEMAESGYAFQWQVLNAKYFGVPQSRQRVFVIGHLGNECSREIFFEQEDGGKNLKELTKNVSQGYRVYDQDGIACTQASQAGGVGAKTGLYAIGGFRIRRLTPTECERLMGLPDGWTAEGIEGKISDSQRYKLCGNGVCVNVVEEIIKKLAF